MSTLQPPRPTIETAINITEAIASNQHFYITGRACSKGHIAWRKTNGRECMACRNSWEPGPWLVDMDELPPRLAVRIRTNRPLDDMLPSSPVAQQVRKNMARARVRPLQQALAQQVHAILSKEPMERTPEDVQMIAQLDEFERNLIRWLRRKGILSLVPGLRRRAEARALTPIVAPAEPETGSLTARLLTRFESEMGERSGFSTPPDESESPKQPASWSEFNVPD